METFRIVTSHLEFTPGKPKPCEGCGKMFRKRTTDKRRPFCVECSPYAQSVKARVKARVTR